MKKYFLVLLFLTSFYGCKKEFNDIVNPVEYNYSVVGINSFSSFNYTPLDSTITFWIKIEGKENVKEAFIELYQPGSSNGPKINLNDAGVDGDVTLNDGIFSADVNFSQNDLNGNYTVEYYVVNKIGEATKAAVHTFTFNNGQANIPPVILSVNVEPDTMIVIDTTAIKSVVQVSDENGLSDIETVFFIVTRPDGTSNGARLELYDNGLFGDDVANDGFYSWVFYVFNTNMKGTYRFDFQAIDRGKKSSSIVPVNVVIQ